MSSRRSTILVLAALGAVGILLLAALYMTTGFGIPCAFHLLTGLHCPGCGTMRAVVSLLRLRPLEALHNNALLFIFIPCLLALGGFHAWRSLQGKPAFTSGRSEMILAVSLGALAVVFAILRNLPTFSFLAPLP